MNKIILSTEQLREYLKEWGEYSCSVPTGTTVGKKWLRNQSAFTSAPRDNWYIGEYLDKIEIDSRGQEHIIIAWTKVIVWDEDVVVCGKVMGS